jgi:hypothetical protein
MMVRSEPAASIPRLRFRGFDSVNVPGPPAMSQRTTETTPTRAAATGRRDLGRWAAVVYLAVQGVVGLAWWVAAARWPEFRKMFVAVGTPDVVLAAFAGADLVLFVGGSLAGAIGLAVRARWTWPVLCVHAGAAAYAACYCLLQWPFAPEAWRSAVLMAPALVVPPVIAYVFRPRPT